MLPTGSAAGLAAYQKVTGKVAIQERETPLLFPFPLLYFRVSLSNEKGEIFILLSPRFCFVLLRYSHNVKPALFKVEFGGF